MMLSLHIGRFCVEREQAAERCAKNALTFVKSTIFEGFGDVHVV